MTTDGSVTRNGRSTDTDLVYLIVAEGTNTAKIGVSNEVERRLRSIQLMSPVSLRLMWTTPGSYPLEASLHSHFASYRSHGEWFTFPSWADPVERVQVAVMLIQYASGDGPGWRQIPQQPEETLDGWLHGRLLRTFKADLFTWEHAAAAIGAPIRFVQDYGAKLVAKKLVREHHRRPGVYYTRWQPEDWWGFGGV